jgi:hypothetical protein
MKVWYLARVNFSQLPQVPQKIPIILIVYKSDTKTKKKLFSLLNLWGNGFTTAKSQISKFFVTLDLQIFTTKIVSFKQISLEVDVTYNKMSISYAW